MARSTNYRFYLSPEAWEDSSSSSNFQLGDEEAHHCRDVMRCQKGDRVAVFNGVGSVRKSEIIDLSRKELTLQTISSHQSAPLPAQIALGQAIPKGKNMDLIIQKATELGISRIVPLLTTNTVVQIKEKEREKKREKWQRIAIEACKQCGQNWLPIVEEPTSVKKYINERSETLNIVAAINSESRPFKKIIAEYPNRPDTASLLIGPEGDFTKEEITTAVDQQFHQLSLGPIILRSETAAIFSLSLLVYELMER